MERAVGVRHHGVFTRQCGFRQDEFLKVASFDNDPSYRPELRAERIWSLSSSSSSSSDRGAVSAAARSLGSTGTWSHALRTKSSGAPNPNRRDAWAAAQPPTANPPPCLPFLDLTRLSLLLASNLSLHTDKERQIDPALGTRSSAWKGAAKRGNRGADHKRAVARARRRTLFPRRRPTILIARC